MKRVSIFIIALFLVVACKKHNMTSYYFKFQYNGNSYSLDSIYAIIDTTAGVYKTTIYSLNTYDQDYVHIQLISDNGSVTGSYLSGYSTAFPRPTDLFSIVPSSSIWVYHPLMSYFVYPSLPFTLTISSASKTAIGGSFTGSDTTAINGTFYIRVDSL